MDSINLITRRRVKGSQIEQVGRLINLLQPEESKNDWDYLYKVLEPVHAYEKPKKREGSDAKVYHTKIFGGTSYGVGKRFVLL